MTYAIPTYDDYSGLWGTLAALREYQDVTALVVVDNNPDGAHAPANEKACGEFGARYVAEPVVGNARAKQKCVESSPPGPVCVLDSHVVLARDFTGAVARARATLAARGVRPETCILQGPLCMGDTWATHMADEWRGVHWGTWGDDRVRRLAPGAEPFEIGAMGMGVFVVDRDFFLRHAPFAPDLIGFTGEEWYTHTKYRRAGGGAYCAPALAWRHRFHQPHMPLSTTYGGDVLRANYVRQHSELGLDMSRILPVMPDAPAPAPAPAPPPDASSGWTEYVKPGWRVLLDEDYGVWDRVFRLEAGALPGCSLQVKGHGELYAAAVKYALRKADVYDAKGYDAVLCDGGRVGAYAAGADKPSRIVCAVIDPHADCEPPAGYWTYRKGGHFVCYTRDPADAEPGLPGRVTMLRNLAVSLVKGGLSAANPELVQARKDVCESNGGVCPGEKRRISDDRCSECGCSLQAKRSLAGQQCPLAYW